METKQMGYLILVYDVSEKRVNKVMKVCRKYLYHIQNSVFMGECDKVRYNLLREELLSIIKKEEDYILLIGFRKEDDMLKEHLGKNKRENAEDDFI